MPGGPHPGPGKPPLAVSGWRCPLTALCLQYEQTLPVLAEPDPRQELRAQIRKNITETLVSLRVNTVDDIQQVAAALAQCTVGQTQPHGSPAPPHLESSLPSQACTAVCPQGSGHKKHGEEGSGQRGVETLFCAPPRTCGPHPVAQESAARLGWALF